MLKQIQVEQQQIEVRKVELANYIPKSPKKVTMSVTTQTTEAEWEVQDPEKDTQAEEDSRLEVEILSESLRRWTTSENH